MRPPSMSGDEFVIRGGGNEFADRQKQMFDQLTRAEKEFKKDQNCSSLSQSDMEIIRGRVVRFKSVAPAARTKRKETTQYRGKESIFKRPEGPAPLSAAKSVPDHHKNPHKWVKYSLEDVDADQMSDRTNAQTAFAFLRELKARRACERADFENVEKMDTDGGVLSTSTFTFRKTRSGRSTNATSSAVVVERDEKPTFRNSTIILPEYVVGQKAQKKMRRTGQAARVDESKRLKLHHLLDIIDE